MTSSQNGNALTTAEQKALRRLVAVSNEATIAAEVEIAPETLARAMAGLGVRRGTLALIRQRLGNGKRA